MRSQAGSVAPPAATSSPVTGSGSSPAATISRSSRSRCPACHSESLGIVVGTAATDDAPVPVMAPGAYGEFGPDDVDRFEAAGPIDADDVNVVRRLLADGDLAALLGPTEPPAAGSSR